MKHEAYKAGDYYKVKSSNNYEDGTHTHITYWDIEHSENLRKTMNDISIGQDGLSNISDFMFGKVDMTIKICDVWKYKENEEKGINGEMAYPHPIHQNALPHCDFFQENGYTKEEMKLTNETKKILDETIEVTATAVRVPVVGGHSESVNITFENDFDLDEVRFALNQMEGVVVVDNPTKNEYPMPINSHKKEEVFVGRIRRDFSQEKTLNMWVVADNLRKGAATNTVQIAEYLIRKKLL